MREHLPILVELVLVFGGALAFAWWQLRDVARAQQQTRAQRLREQQDAVAGATSTDPASRPTRTDGESAASNAGRSDAPR
jgi:cytoskeletal protein RodZ